MCMFLNEPTKTKIIRKPEVAFKAFKKWQGKLQFPYFNQVQKVSRGRWMTAKRGTTGFHVFKTKQGARSWMRTEGIYGVVLPIKVRGKVKGVGLNQGIHAGFRITQLLVP